MLIKEFTMGCAYTRIFSDRKEMGTSAGRDIAACIRELLKTKDHLNIMFAAAPSQNEVLEQLLSEDVDWTRINAFHMDEYIGIDPAHHAGFARFLARAIFSRLPFASVNYINCAAEDPVKEAERYAALLQANPLDICVLGIGENGHIAFNDPDVADFHDPLNVKVVLMDERSRIQQVNDGCFATLSEVPRKAITVTIPCMTSAQYLFCSVPCVTKAEAVARVFRGDVSTECPATILRTIPNSNVYLDADSASKLLAEVSL